MVVIRGPEYAELVATLRSLISSEYDQLATRIGDGSVLGDLEEHIDFLKTSFEILNRAESAQLELKHRPRRRGPGRRKRERKAVRFPCPYKGCSFIGTTPQGLGRHKRFHADAGDPVT